MRNISTLLSLIMAAIMVTSCSESKTSTEEKAEISRMDSLSKAVEDSTERLEEQTKRVEESLEKLDKEFETEKNK